MEEQKKMRKRKKNTKTERISVFGKGTCRECCHGNGSRPFGRRGFKFPAIVEIIPPAFRTENTNRTEARVFLFLLRACCFKKTLKVIM